MRLCCVAMYLEGRHTIPYFHTQTRTEQEQFKTSVIERRIKTKMKTYHINFAYEIELEAENSEQAFEMAENSLSNAINSEGTNCFESEVNVKNY